MWQAEGTSAQSVAALARVDAVKQRMDAAHETLQVDLTQSKHTFSIAKTISYTAARYNIFCEERVR